MSNRVSVEVIALALGLLCGLPAAAARAAPAACAPLLQHQLPRLQDEKPVDLCQYAGRVLLVRQHQYLLSRDGTLVSSHAPAIDPQDPGKSRGILRLLDIK